MHQVNRAMIRPATKSTQNVNLFPDVLETTEQSKTRRSKNHDQKARTFQALQEYCNHT